MIGKRTPNWRIIILVTVVVAVFAGLAVGTGSAERKASAVGSMTYQDSTGDVSSAPDIAGVTVANNNDKMLTFTVAFANRGALNPSEALSIRVDNDSNAATGKYGDDYMIVLTDGLSFLGRWDASAETFLAAPMNSLVSLVRPGSVVINLSAAELAVSTAFRFNLTTVANTEDESTELDFAPDLGRDPWAYQLKLYVKPVVSVGAIELVPAAVKAGKKLIASTQITVTRSGVTEKLPPGSTIVWKGRIGSVVLKPSKTTLGTAGGTKSVWAIPLSAAGKQLRLTATVTVEKIVVSKIVVAKVA